MKSPEDILNIGEVSVIEKTPGMGMFLGNTEGRGQYLKEVMDNASIILEPEILADVTLYMRTTGEGHAFKGHFKQ